VALVYRWSGYGIACEQAPTGNGFAHKWAPTSEAGLDEAELHFAFFADHGLVPGRLPGDADIGGADAGDEEDFAFGVFGNRGAHAAAGRGERHGDVDFVGGAFGRCRGGNRFDVHGVNEAEVDDVYGDLGVVNFFELVPDGFGVGGAAGEGGGGDAVIDNGFADGVTVFAVDAEEAEIGLNGVAAAEALVDEEGGAGVEGVFVTARDLGGDEVAGEGAFFGHGGGGRSQKTGVRIQKTEGGVLMWKAGNQERSEGGRSREESGFRRRRAEF
jgi:hypothetical protein